MGRSRRQRRVRGLYEWDGAEQAADYANHLVRLVNPFSIQGSVRYHVIPGCRREDFLRDPELVAAGRGKGFMTSDG